MHDIGYQPAYQHHGDFGIALIVFSQQQPFAGESRRGGFGDGRGINNLALRRARQEYGKPEARALAGLAGDADCAAHQFDDLACDGEPQSRAAETARGRAIGLGEGIENHFLLVQRNADAGITNFKVHTVQ